MTNKHTNKIFYIILIILPIAIALISLCFGRMMISPKDIYNSIFHFDLANKTSRLIVVNIRIPRILLSLLCGMGLSVAGLSFQALFANPLATPDTIGVASGASFGAVLAILLSANQFTIQLISVVMGLVAVALTWFNAKSKNLNLSYLVLSGIMVGSVFNALVSLIKFIADPDSKLPAITYWLMGGLGNSDYKSLAVGAPLILISIFIIYLLRWRLNLLSLSEDELMSQGVNVKRLRVAIIVLSTVMTASVISMCGQVGWVGLIVPHMCKMRFGNNHVKLVPIVISVGASFMVIVDTIARSATATEIPISIITALIGAPFFIYLLKLMRRKTL